MINGQFLSLSRPIGFNYHMKMFEAIVTRLIRETSFDSRERERDVRRN